MSDTEFKSISAGEYIRMVEELPDDFFTQSPTLDWVKSFHQLTGKIHKQAVDKGWWDKPGEAVLMIGVKLFLSVGELAEGYEEIRKKKKPNEIYWKEDEHGQLKPEGFPIELADAVIRICDLAAWCGVDLANAIRIKMAFNAGRPFRHGGKAV